MSGCCLSTHSKNLQYCRLINTERREKTTTDFSQATFHILSGGMELCTADRACSTSTSWPSRWHHLQGSWVPMNREIGLMRCDKQLHFLTFICHCIQGPWTDPISCSSLHALHLTVSHSKPSTNESNQGLIQLPLEAGGSFPLDFKESWRRSSVHSKEDVHWDL